MVAMPHWLVVLTDGSTRSELEGCKLVLCTDAGLEELDFENHLRAAEGNDQLRVIDLADLVELAAACGVLREV